MGVCRSVESLFDGLVRADEFKRHNVVEQDTSFGFGKELLWPPIKCFPTAKDVGAESHRSREPFHLAMQPISRSSRSSYQPTFDVQAG